MSEQEIADAKAVLGRDGIGCEPASATTVAGLKRMMLLGQGEKPDVTIDPDEDVVAILTGHQLKDPEYTVNYHLDNLYEHASYKNVLVEKSGKVTSTFKNQPSKSPPTSRRSSSCWGCSLRIRSVRQSRERNERSEVATGLCAATPTRLRSGTQSGRYFATLVTLPALTDGWQSPPKLPPRFSSQT